MPQILRHIDEIARAKGRDVLFVSFCAMEDLCEFEMDEVYRARSKAFTDHLEANGIAWEPCGHFAREDLMMGYRGLIYIDAPFEVTNPQYQIVSAYLENPDGTLKNPAVRFYAVSLEQAMQNAHHDEPGFWEKWAENF